MLFTWTSQLLDCALTGLSERQLAALDLAANTLRVEAVAHLPIELMERLP